MTPGESGSPVAAVLAQLEAAFDAAESLPLSCLRPDDVRDWACGVQRIRARAEALVCRGAVAVGSAGLPALDGPRSVAAVLAAHTRANPRTVAGDVRLGAWLARYPVFDAALGRGRISRGHIDAVRRVENPRTAAHLADAQEYLVTAAESCEWRDFLQVLRYWELAFDPDGDEPDDQVRSRSCRVGKNPDGTVTGRFRLDPIAGHAFLTALEREEQRLYRRDTEAGGGGPIRTASQRRADALANLVTRGAARPNGTFPAPLVHVVIGHQVVTQLLAALDDDTPRPTALEIDPHDVNRRCELVDGTPIHPRTAVAAAALAAFRRHVLRAPSQTLDVGRTVRAFPPALKAALLVAARGRCQVVGCDAPVSRLQADHVTAWNRHGPTALHNGQVLCDAHNRHKRDGPAP